MIRFEDFSSKVKYTQIKSLMFFKVVNERFIWEKRRECSTCNL